MFAYFNEFKLKVYTVILLFLTFVLHHGISLNCLPPVAEHSVHSFLRSPDYKDIRLVEAVTLGVADTPRAYLKT